MSSRRTLCSNAGLAIAAGVIFAGALLPSAAIADGTRIRNNSGINTIMTGNAVSGSIGGGIAIINNGGPGTLINTTIMNSTVSGNGGDGIVITNTGGVSTVDLSGNAVGNNAANGISITNNSTMNATITNSTISGNSGSGISINNTGSFSGSLRESDLTGNGTGVSLTNTGISFNMDMGTGTSGNAAGNNNFGIDSSTMNAVDVMNNTGTNVSAQSNFWGRSKGPRPGAIVDIGTSTTDASNPLRSRRIR